MECDLALLDVDYRPAGVRRGDFGIAIEADDARFTEIGEQIIASLVKAADEQVAEAEAMRVKVMQLADSIGEQLREQSKALAEMHERTKAFLSKIL